MAIGVVAKRITMPCDIESRRPAHRQAAWHKDCPSPRTCPCQAHERDAEPVDEQ